MTQDAPASAKKQRRYERRPWPRWPKWRVILVLILVLGIVGWRYGWPARSWETTVCPLEEIDWQMAVLLPQCLGSGWSSGARNVFLTEGSLDEGKKPVLDLENTRYGDSESVRLYRDILHGLVLPNLSGQCFLAGVFWVDTPAGNGDAVAQPYDPAPAHLRPADV